MASSKSAHLVGESYLQEVPLPCLRTFATGDPPCLNAAATPLNWSVVMAPKNLGKIFRHFCNPHVGRSSRNRSMTSRWKLLSCGMGLQILKI